MLPSHADVPAAPTTDPPTDATLNGTIRRRLARRRAAGEGTIYREGKYWVVEIQWTNEEGTHRRRRKRTTRTAAVAARETLLREIHEGSVAIGPDAQTTVAQALERYLSDAQERVRARTLRDYRRYARDVLIPALGRLRAHMLRRKDVVRMLAAVNGARSKQFAYVLLKAAMSPYVRAVGPIDHPFPPRSRPRVPRHIVPAFDLALIGRVLAAAQDGPLEVFVVLALASGLRESEILGLTWGNVCDGFLIVHQRLDEYTHTLGPTKTDGSQRRVDIPPAVLRLLLSAREQRKRRPGASVGPDDLVICSARGTPMDAANLRRAWRRLRERHGLPPLRLYDLRHAHASLLAEKGLASKVIAERLGHASTRLTDDTYSHLMPGMQIAASAIIGAMLDDATEDSSRSLPPS